MSLAPFLRSGLTSSSWKLVAGPILRLGGALLIGGALAASISPGSQQTRATGAGSYRLVLETVSDPACVYGSAWSDGDVVMPHDASDGRVVTLTSRYDFADGCTWEAAEVLTPTGDGYSYEYSEHIVACAPAATPGLACPRKGHVAVVPNAQ